ncbi:MAG: TonB-dependent receptor [Bacteroidetes bacterium 4572_77]|nr:MAG: TonB-dependent receptor [Bacteroidetes bacterium 4572_77]
MKNLKTFIFVIMFSLFFTIGYAQTDTTIYMEEILVTAKADQNINKTNINGKVLEIENPHDGGAMFKNQVGFGVEKRGNYGMEPVLRGFKYSQLNVQIDGGVHSANACPNRMDPAISQISPEEIKKIEVIKGPYNVRFGSALGGVINIVSNRPSRIDNHLVSGSVNAGYQSNGGNFYSNAFAQIVGEKFDFSLNAGYKEYGNYKSGSGQEIASSFTRWGYTLKAGANIKENQRLQFTLRQSSARDVLYAGLPMDGDHDNSTIASLDYGVRNLSESIFMLKAKVYGSFVDHEMSNLSRPASRFTHAISPVQAQVYGGRTELGINMSSKDVVFVGVDYKHIAKQGHRDRTVYENPCNPGQIFPIPNVFQDKTWQDSKKNDLGVFFENKFEITSSLEWMAALRLDIISFAINDPADDFKAQYNGEITPDTRIDPTLTTSLTWYLNKDINVQWAVARAMRSPDLSELFINHLSIGLDAYEYLGNPNLKSEVNYQSDIRIEKNWKNVSVYGDVYYSLLQNYITAKLDTSIHKKYMACKPPAGTKVFQNIDKAFMTGFEAGVEVSFLKHFIYSLGAAYTYAQNVSWDEPLSEIPPFAVNTNVAYKTKKINANIHARIVSEQDRISTSFKESITPGFTVMDFYLTYSPWEFVDVNVSVTNMFDVNYVEHLSRPYKAMDTQSLYYEPGRSFNIGAKFMF